MNVDGAGGDVDDPELVDPGRRVQLGFDAEVGGLRGDGDLDRWVAGHASRTLQVIVCGLGDPPERLDLVGLAQ